MLGMEPGPQKVLTEGVVARITEVVSPLPPTNNLREGGSLDKWTVLSLTLFLPPSEGPGQPA